MNIDEVQRRLWEQSQAHKQHRESGTPLFPTNPYGGRIRNLMDLMHNPTWIAAACDRVLKRSRGKASGVDGVRAHEFERARDHRLEELRLELKRGTYRPLPLRRVEIPKANGKMRQLGIPCLRDKIVQEAIRMALEPIFEVEFHENSYGFRPNRSAHHAVARCRHMALTGFTWVIEGDVKACFDEISHKAILRCIREKVMDNKFLGLIHLPVKSGRGNRWCRSSDDQRGSPGWRGLTAPSQHRAEQTGLVYPLQGVPRRLDGGATTDCPMSGSPAMPTIGACFSHGPIGGKRNGCGTRFVASFGKHADSNCLPKRPGLPT